MEAFNDILSSLNIHFAEQKQVNQAQRNLINIKENLAKTVIASALNLPPTSVEISNNLSMDSKVGILEYEEDYLIVTIGSQFKEIQNKYYIGNDINTAQFYRDIIFANSSDIELRKLLSMLRFNTVTRNDHYCISEANLIIDLKTWYDIIINRYDSLDCIQATGKEIYHRELWKALLDRVWNEPNIGIKLSYLLTTNEALFGGNAIDSYKGDLFELTRTLYNNIVRQLNS